MKNAKHKQLKKSLLWGTMALVVLTLAVMPLLAAPREEPEGPQASILSGTVQRGNIEQFLRGGGTLTASEQVQVELPSGVKITGFLVKNGDFVTAGTPLAAIDRVTLMAAIVQVQETLTHLQKEMASAQDDTISAYIKATAGGRVKKVYAREGEPVQEVMLRDGALAVLSLDGLMAVTLTRNMPLSTGESVWVALSDGTEVQGRVKSNLNGTIVVTIEDEGYPIGEKVTVTTDDGDRVGSGELYVHNAWTATGFSGTVSAIHAKEETTVYSGSTLMTLKDTDYTAGLEQLAKEHREYEQLLQDMLLMYRNGAIVAPCDGLVSGMDPESPYLLSGEESRWEPQPLGTAAEKRWSVVLLSQVEELPSQEATEETLPAEGPEQVLPGNPDAEIPEFWVGVCTRDDSCTAELHFEDCPRAVTEETPEAALYTGWAAVVIAVDGEAGVTWVMKDPNGITVSDPQNPPALDASAMTEVTSITGTTYADGSEIAAGDYVLLADGGGVIRLSVSSGGDKEERPDMGSMGEKGQAAMGSAAVQEPAFEPYPPEGSVLLTVTAQETMTITITLDEQDIAKVHEGQAAQVKVTALRGQVFEGTVTDVSVSGTNSGGSSKFTAEVTVPVAENMLGGMSATVSIPLYTRMEVLTIPVAALVENGTQTQVCTGLDEETGLPSNPVSVTIGISDGETAQILEGLEMGDEYYYSYYDTLEVSTAVERAARGFGR